VTVSSANGQVAVSPTTATVSSSNWATSIDFTITAIDDSAVEGIHHDTVQIQLASSDPDYTSPESVVSGEVRGVSLAELQISIELLDNDAAVQVDTTPAPVLVSAALVETRHEVQITFDRATDRSGMGLGQAAGISCSSMGVFDASTLTRFGGSTAMCYWSSDRVLVAMAGSSGSIVVEPEAGSSIVIRGGVIRASAASIYSASGTLAVQGRLPIPAISSIRFSTSGAQLLVTFTSRTSGLIADGLPSGLCSSVFSNAELLGPTSGSAASTCVFTSAMTMKVVLGIGAEVEPLLLYDPLAQCSNTVHGLSIRGNGAVRPAVGSVNSVAAACSIVQAPLVAPSPPVAII